MSIDWKNLDVTGMGYANTEYIYGVDGNARNLSTFANNFSAMALIAQNRFKWESEVIKPYDRLSEYIEMLLFWLGQCCLAEEGGVWKVKKCVTNGNIGKYGLPTKFTTCDYDGSNTVVYNYDDVIWIKNNAFCIPTYAWLRKYCDRISHIERVMDLNIDAQKTPYIIESTPEVQLSVKNVFKKIKEMSEVIFLNANKGGIRDKVKVLNLNAPYLVDKLYAQKQNEFNDALNFIGINTIDEKKERLITGEAEISEEFTDSCDDMFYSARKIALKQAEKRIGKGALKLTINENPMKRGQKNEQLHDTPEKSA